MANEISSGSNCSKCTCQECSCVQGGCAKAKKATCCFVKFLAIAALIGWYCWASEAFKSSGLDARKIEVSVDVEREVKADYVIWRVGFQNAGADIKVLQEKFAKDRALVLAFLKSKGFTDAEMSVGGPRMVDQFAKKSGKNSEKVSESSRYVIYSRIKVLTSNVDAVIQAVKEVDGLVKDGVVLVQDEKDVNPRYYLRNQAQVESDLHNENCAKAKAIGERIATSMGVKLGKLKSIKGWQSAEIRGQGQANQGGSWGNNERLRGPIKIAHLHQCFEFLIH